MSSMVRICQRVWTSRDHHVWLFSSLLLTVLQVLCPPVDCTRSTGWNPVTLAHLRRCPCSRNVSCPLYRLCQDQTISLLRANTSTVTVYSEGMTMARPLACPRIQVVGLNHKTYSRGSVEAKSSNARDTPEVTANYFKARLSRLTCVCSFLSSHRSRGREFEHPDSLLNVERACPKCSMYIYIYISNKPECVACSTVWPLIFNLDLHVLRKFPCLQEVLQVVSLCLFPLVESNVRALAGGRAGSCKWAGMPACVSLSMRAGGGLGGGVCVGQRLRAFFGGV